MTASFLSYILDTVRAECAGVADVYSEREKSLLWLVGKSMSSTLGVACVVSLPTLRAVEGEPLHSRAQRMSATIAIRRKATLCSTDSFALAERIYTKLHGSTWREPTCEVPTEALQPNVGCDELRHTEGEGGDALHTFTVSADVTI